MYRKIIPYLFGFLLFFSLSCNRSVSGLETYTEYTQYFGDNDITLQVLSKESLTEEEEAGLFWGVLQGFRRYTSCKQLSGTRYSTIQIRLVANLGPNVLGKYVPRENTIYVTNLLLTEVLEHEIADHFLPYIHGDNSWDQYGHLKPPICTSK